MNGGGGDSVIYGKSVCICIYIQSKEGEKKAGLWGRVNGRP